jgi:hypothetical protein
VDESAACFIPSYKLHFSLRTLGAIHMSDDWNLVVSFEIDNGELAGLSPEDAFVLGVEFELFHEDLTKTPLALK